MRRGVRRGLVVAFVGLVYGYLLGPLAVVIATSLDPSSQLRFPPQGLSLRWYGAFLQSGAYMRAIQLSLLLAAAAALVSLAVGIPAAFAIVRHRFRGRETLNALFLSPLMVPTIVLGIALLIFFSQLRMRISFSTLLCGHVVIALPYVVRIVAANLYRFDASLEEAAANLGARGWQVLWRVTFPLLAPGIVAGAVFAFIISFENVTVSMFLTAPGLVTLPIQMYTQIEHYLDPTVSAVSSAVLILTLAVVLSLTLRGATSEFN